MPAARAVGRQRRRGVAGRGAGHGADAVVPCGAHLLAPPSTSTVMPRSLNDAGVADAALLDPDVSSPSSRREALGAQQRACRPRTSRRRSRRRRCGQTHSFLPQTPSRRARRPACSGRRRAPSTPRRSGSRERVQVVLHLEQAAALRAAVDHLGEGRLEVAALPAAELGGDRWGTWWRSWWRAAQSAEGRRGWQGWKGKREPGPRAPQPGQLDPFARRCGHSAAGPHLARAAGPPRPVSAGRRTAAQCDEKACPGRRRGLLAVPAERGWRLAGARRSRGSPSASRRPGQPFHGHDHDVDGVHGGHLEVRDPLVDGRGRRRRRGPPAPPSARPRRPFALRRGRDGRRRSQASPAAWTFSHSAQAGIGR